MAHGRVDRKGIAGTVRRDGVVDRVRPDRRSAERREMGAAHQGGAHVGGEHAHVRATRARHPERHIRRIEGHQVEGVDADRSRVRLEALALPSRLVELPAADLHRAVRRRPLEGLPDQCSHRRCDLHLGDVDRRLANDITLGVQRGRLHTQPKRPLVGLGQTAEEAKQASRATDPDQE